MSNARNMVRALRDAGTLETTPPVVSRTRTLTTILIGLAFGASAYFISLAVIPQLPHLGTLLQKAPPPAHFVKPAG